MQGQCKPNAIELARIAEAQPVLAFDNAKVRAFWKPANIFSTNNCKTDNYLTYIKAIDFGQKPRSDSCERPSGAMFPLNGISVPAGRER
jgi:hypothetical protein